MKQRLESLQAGRGLAALFVLLYHSPVFLRQVHPGSWLAGAFEFGSAGVDYFFVLSGFLMMFVHARDFNRPAQVAPYFLKRFKRIYPIYWVLCLLLVPVLLKFPAAVATQGKIGAAIITYSALLLPHAGPRLVGVTWSLEYEVCFYVVFAALLFSRRVGTTVFILWSMAILGFGILGPLFMNVNEPQTSTLFFLLSFFLNVRCAEFILGMVTALLFKRLLELQRPAWLLIVSLALFASFAVMDDIYKFSHNSPRGRAVVYGVISAAIILTCGLTEQVHRFKLPSWLQLLGAASYSIYLTHFLVIAAARNVAEHVPGLAALPAFVLLFGVVAVALVPGILLHLWVERPMLNRMFRRPPPLRSIATLEKVEHSRAS